MEWNKRLVSLIAIVAVTSFMGTFLISAVNIALPAIGEDFNLDAVSLSWVVTSFLLSTAMLMLPAGKWADVSGIRRLFKVGIVVFSLSSIMCGLAGSGFWLIVFRFLQGIGAAFTNTSGSAILVSSFPPRYRGRVLGMAVSAVYLGLAFGPFVGGILTQYLGWRSIFLISGSLNLLTTLIAFLFLGRDGSELSEIRRPNLKGTLFYMAGLVTMVYGSARIPSLEGWIMMGGGLLFLVYFWRVEKRSALPVIDVQLFTRNRLFAFSNMAALINYSATFAIIFLMSLYLQKVRGLNPRDAGSILIAQPVVMALLSPLSGKLSDRVQPRYLTSLGMGLCTLGLGFFALLTDVTPIWLIIILLAGMGLGFALFSSPNMNTIMSSVDRSQYGLASGTASTMRVLGQIVSMTIATLFFSAVLGKQTIGEVPGPHFMKAMKWGFTVFALISTTGIYFSWNRGKVNREHD